MKRLRITRKQRMALGKKVPLYRAWYRHDDRIAPMPGDIIYERKPSGNLIGELPLGSLPTAEGTMGRQDGGDPFEHAVLQTPSGRFIVIERQS